MLADAAANQLQGEVVQVDDAIAFLALGFLRRENNTAMVEVGMPGFDTDGFLRPGPVCQAISSKSRKASSLK